MPIYNKEIAQAAANIAGMFAPPSGAEAAGWANANAKNAEARRIADFYASASTLAPDAFDRQGIALNLFDPSQGYGLTTRAQDIGSADNRYSVDTTAATSRANNAADNAGALADRQMQEGGLMARQYAEPLVLSEGQTAVVPPATAAASGLGQFYQGNVKAAPGERVFSPSGQMFEGADKPMSSDELIGAIMGEMPTSELQQFARDKFAPNETQVEGAILRGLPQADQNAAVLSDIPVEQAVGPDGSAIFARRSDAVGQRPAPAQTAPTELSSLQRERAALIAGNPDDPRIREYDRRIGALGRGYSQDAYSVASDKAMAAQNQQLQEAAAGARSKLSTLDYIGRLIAEPNLDTGAGANIRLEMKKALQAIGIEVGDVGSAEALRAVSNQFALELRDPSGGAGMPGALSDSDRQFLVSMVPGLQNTPEGNRRILDFAAKVARRNVEVERLRQDYVRRNGRIDENFVSSVSDFAEANPLFAESALGVSGQGSQSGDYPDATIIENDAGEQLIRRSGKWEPYNG